MTITDFEKDLIPLPDGKTLTVGFLGHASLLLEYDGHVILTDPVSAEADYAQLPKADVILITHEHSDHFDPQAIAAASGTGTIIVSNPAVHRLVGRGTSLTNGEGADPTDYLHIEAVPAYNTTPGRDIYHPKGRDNSYVLTLGEARIYLAGDTEDIPEMAQLGRIDIAFLPVNQPYTMTPEQAVRAAETIRPRILYPYHYGQTPIEELKTLPGDDPSIDVRIRRMP